MFLNYRINDPLIEGGYPEGKTGIRLEGDRNLDRKRDRSKDRDITLTLIVKAYLGIF